ncbi:MAG: TIM-barrel domain-containing protein [Planctomycetota bacterium]
MNTTDVNTNVYRLRIQPEEGRCTVDVQGVDSSVFESTSPFLLAPEFVSGDQQYEVPRIVTERHLPRGEQELVLRSDIVGEVSGWVENHLYCLRDRIVCTARYLVDADHHVSHWHVLGEGSRLGMAGVHAYIGESEKYLDGRELSAENLDVSTSSHNFKHWNVCPRLVFMDGNVLATVGGTEIAHDYGLELKTDDGRGVEHMRFNYGGEAAPHPGEAGQVHRGPRLQVKFTFGSSPLRAQKIFTRDMIDDGIVPPQKYRPEQLPWRRPWYCTWADQVLLSQNFDGDADWKGKRPANGILDQELVLRAARRIDEWDLNVGTIVMDAGWQDRRGDWNLDTDRFPDIRGMVDEIHGLGFKFHMWWAPLQVEKGAQVLEREGFTYELDEIDEYALNYTNPELRRYVAEKVDRWFSSGPGGWDIDGLKLDWLCERIQPVENAIDPDWRGEERALYKMQRMFCDIASRHKDAFLIKSQPRNPHLANLSPVTGISENFSDDLSHLTRSLPSLKAWMPGWWLKAHCVYQPGQVAEHVRLMRGMDPDGIPEIGIVLPENMPDEKMPELREALKSSS